MQRRCSDGVADVHEAWISFEQPADFLSVLAGNRGMNGMTVGSGQHAAAAIPRFFQESCDLGMSPIARHGDRQDGSERLSRTSCGSVPPC
jgi:hypothetical protein